MNGDPTAGDRALPDLIRDLVGFLSRDALTIEDVAARVGSVAHDPGGLMPLQLHPVLVGVRSARLARYPDSGVPYVLTLGLAPATRPTVAALKAVLGDYRQALTDWDRPIEIIFYPPGGAQWTVAVIAQLAPGAASPDDALISTLALRRDPVG